MAEIWRREDETVREGEKAAIEETAKWIGRQIEQVWCALGAADKQEEREVNIQKCEKWTEYEFVHKGKLLATARSYFSFGEYQWKFELVQVDQEHYQAVKEYFGRKI